MVKYTGIGLGFLPIACVAASVICKCVSANFMCGFYAFWAIIFSLMLIGVRND